MTENSDTDVETTNESDETSVTRPDSFTNLMARNFGPKPEETVDLDDYFELNLAHASMQFSDPKRQQKSDVETLFTRGYHWITGTEAGKNGTLDDVLRVYAAKHGYTFHMFKSNWIAVKRELIKRGSYAKGGETIVDNDFVKGNGNDPAIAFVEFDNDEIGHTLVMAGHYPKDGRPQGKPSQKVNLKWNKKFGQAIGDMAVEKAVGRAIGFYGGDQNIIDRKADTFFGAPMTSAWDEKGKWENTGHGNIDVIASYDGDARVSVKYVRALDDSELPLYTDHYLVEAGYMVRKLK